MVNNVYNNFDYSKYKRQSFLLIASYFCIIFLVIIFNIMGYTTAFQIIQREYEEVCYSELEQTKAVYESQFTNLEVMAEQLVSMRSVQALLQHSDLTALVQKEYAKQVINEMKLVCNMLGDSLYSDCFILIKDQNMCINKRGMDKFDDAYYSYFRHYYPNCEAWVNDVFYSKPKMYKRFSYDGSVCYLRTNHRNNAQVAVVVLIDPVNAVKLIPLNEKWGFSVRGISEDITLLGKDYQSEFLDRIEKNAQTERYNGEKYVCLSAMNTTKMRQYIYMIPYADFFDKLWLVRFGFVMGNAICAVFCVVLAVLFSQRLYRPISMLVQRLGGNSKNLESEFLFINQKLSEFVDEHKVFRDKACQGEQILAKSNLQRILIGEIALKESEWGLLENLKLIPTQELFVLIFDITDIGLLKAEEGEASSIQNDFQMACFSIVNVLTELVEEFARVSSCIINGNLVCVVSCQNCSAEIMLKQRVRYMYDFLKEKLQMCFICGSSEGSADPERLSDLYEQALEIVSLCVFRDGNPILSYRDVDEDASVCFGTEEGFEQLRLAMNTGNAALAIAAIDMLFERREKNKSFSFSIMRMRYFEVMGILLRFLQKKCNEIHYDVHSLMNIQIQNTGQIMENVNKLEQVIRRICSERQSNMQKLTEDNRSQQILEYIQNNYQDPYLNVSVVAQVFDVSLSYISSYFKKATGEGMADYIVNYRIDRAKELLLSNNDTVAAIAERVGFYNVNMFIRAFKKREGLTPGKFRELHKH